MFEKLSKKQNEIAIEKTGAFVVRACPGSGKTYTVSARLARLLKDWKFPSRGIAVLSFTNVAWQEIKSKLENEFNVKSSLGYPHFVGTIDSFINQYIFLPFAHLDDILNCGKRPTMVGAPFSSWHCHRGRGVSDYHRYFDKVSLGFNNQLVYPEISGVFDFGYNKIHSDNGSESGHGRNLRTTKQHFWSLGYATQKDANYWALQILRKYPQITKALALRFPFLLIDEAQDTSEIQMAIINELEKNGTSELMFVGDPDQAIFEWNDAKPQLITKLYEKWQANSCVLNESFRSSQKICDFTFGLSELESKAIAVNPNVKDYGNEPKIITYLEESINTTIADFIKECKSNDIQITAKNVAILYRSENFNNKIESIVPLEFGVSPSDLFPDNDLISFDFCKAKYLIDNGVFKQGYKILDKAIIKLHLNKTNLTNLDVEEYLNKEGFIEHRKELHSILSKLPKTDLTLGNWKDKANENLASLKFSIGVKTEYRDKLFNHLITLTKDLNIKEYYSGTVHSVKGETFEAVLLFLNQKGAKGCHYDNLIKAETKLSENEELRIVYVGITRPSKILWLAVPNNKHELAWKEKLQNESLI
ncbi:MAG: ATP-dependent helicase [Bacteroidota bacterium]